MIKPKRNVPPDEAARSENLIHRLHRCLSMAMADQGLKAGIPKILEHLTIIGEKSVHPQLVWVGRLLRKLTLL